MTLNRYIEPAGRLSLLTGRDRRFARILAASVICHLVFVAIIIRANIWSKWEVEVRRAKGTELVLLTEVGPSAEKRPLRALPQPKEKIDLSHFRHDPERSDDVNLTARSPRLGDPSGTAQSPSRKLQSVKPVEHASAVGTGTRSPISPPVAPVIAQTSVLQNMLVPTPSLPTQGATATAAPPPPAQGAEREERQGTRELSLQIIESQYMAYVRTKILQANQRIMPQDWIKDVLSQKVSADYEVMIARGGRLVSARLVRSSGYSTLDETARQAIYNSKPFEGYPPNAGDAITLRVTVYYAPWR